MRWHPARVPDIFLIPGRWKPLSEAWIAVALLAVASPVFSAPEFGSVSFTAPSGNLNSAVGNLFGKLNVTVGGSGTRLSYIEGRFVHFTGPGKWDFQRQVVFRELAGDHLVRQNGNGGVYEVLVRFPQGLSAGTYRLYSLGLFDAASQGSTRFAEPQDLEGEAPVEPTLGTGIGATISRSGSSGGLPAPSGDADPPQIQQVTFNPPRVDVTSRSAFVDVTISATDNQSGLDSLNLWLASPQGTLVSDFASGAESLVGGQLGNGSFYLRLRVPQGSDAGYYNIEGLFNSDRAGNFVAAPVEGLASLTVTKGDSDGDGTPGVDDAFPFDETETSDNDADGTGDNADLDDDNDSFEDVWERRWGLDPLVADDPESDLDFDGLNLMAEYMRDLNPGSDDTDADGFQDAAEIEAETDPRAEGSTPARLGLIRDAEPGGSEATLKFYSKKNTTYRLESSSDLVRWTTEATGIPGNGRAIERGIPRGTGGAGEKFYRFVEE